MVIGTMGNADIEAAGSNAPQRHQRQTVRTYNFDVEREAEAGIYAPKLEFYADDKRAMLRFLWMTNRPC